MPPGIHPSPQVFQRLKTWRHSLVPPLETALYFQTLASTPAGCFIPMPPGTGGMSVGEKLLQRRAQGPAIAERLAVWVILTDDAAGGQQGSCLPAFLFPIAHPFSVSPAIGAEQGQFLARQIGLTALEHGVKLGFLNCSAPMEGHPKAKASKEPTCSGSNSSAVNSVPPQPWATASAMAWVWPVPLQYTTAILLIVLAPP